jgi:hypothetical protein
MKLPHINIFETADERRLTQMENKESRYLLFNPRSSAFICGS